MSFSVPWEEMDGSPTEERTRDGFRAVRKLKCAWDDRRVLRDELLSFPGDPYPHSPVAANCTGVSSIPFGSYGQGAAQGDTGFLGKPDWAILTCTYETPRTNLAQLNPSPSSPGAVEMISEDMEPTVEGTALWTPPGYELTYDLGRAWRVPKGAEPSLQVYKEMYTFVRHHLSVPPNTLHTLIGRCNQQPLQTKLLGMTFDVETLLFAGCRIGVVSDQLGNRKFTATYNFKYQPWGWNRYPRISPVTGELEFHQMFIGPLDNTSVDGVPIKVCALANFSNI